MGQILCIPFLPILHCIGFTAAGIAAGSWAAIVQASYGVIEAGSWFASCQSIGALASPFCCPCVTVVWVLLFILLVLCLIFGVPILAPIQIVKAWFSAAPEWFQHFWDSVESWFGINGGNNAHNGTMGNLSMTDYDDIYATDATDSSGNFSSVLEDKSYVIPIVIIMTIIVIFIIRKTICSKSGSRSRDNHYETI